MTLGPTESPNLTSLVATTTVNAIRLAVRNISPRIVIPLEIQDRDVRGDGDGDGDGDLVGKRRVRTRVRNTTEVNIVAKI